MPPSRSAAGSPEQRRARIEETALELFRTRGFDHVTVEDVCAEAGVAPATFYRHFGTKEEVVFAYQADFTAALGRALDAGAHLPDAERLPVVLGEFAAFLESQQDVLALRDQIVLGHPRLMHRTLTVQRDMESALAAGLARSRGLPTPDSAVLLEAGVGILVLRIAVRAWRAEGGGSLVTAARQTLVRLQEVVAGLAVDGD